MGQGEGPIGALGVMNTLICSSVCIRHSFFPCIRLWCVLSWLWCDTGDQMTGVNTKWGIYYHQTCQYLATILRLSGIQPCQGGLRPGDGITDNQEAVRFDKADIKRTLVWNRGRIEQQLKLLVLNISGHHFWGHWRNSSIEMTSGMHISLPLLIVPYCRRRSRGEYSH